MSKLTRKLKLVKLELKDWLKKNLGNTYDKLSKNAQKINYMKERLS